MTEERVSNKELKEILEHIANRKDNGLAETITELAKIQAVQTEQMKHLITMSEKMQETLYGNGKEGLVSVVNNLVKEVNKTNVIKNTIITVMISIIVSGLYYLLLMHGRQLIP